MASKFLKLSGCLINTNIINKVVFNPERCSLYIKEQVVCGFFMVGSGIISTQSENIIHVDKTKTPKDYELIKSWIDLQV
jgi:hypothetical protein